MLAAASIPGWAAHPDTWLLVAAIGGGYAIAIRRLGPRFASPGRAPVTRLQLVSFGLGVVAIWVAADWPVHDVAEQSMYSVHMVQHLLLSMVATPLLLLGTPGWLLRYLLRPPSALFRMVRWMARFLPAVIVFNLVIVLTHWPAIVDASLRSGALHFGLHAMIFVASLIVWLPVLSPMPEIPRLAPPTRGAFLFLQSIVPTIPASFLTFGAHPLYKYYRGLPHVWGLSSLEDQQVAGLIMKLGAGILLWMLIGVIFFRWASEEDRDNQPQRLRRELERELSRIQA
jgi:putative membrane protein